MELSIFQKMFSSVLLSYQLASCSCHFRYFVVITEVIVPFYLEIVFEEIELVQMAF